MHTGICAREIGEIAEIETSLMFHEMPVPKLYPEFQVHYLLKNEVAHLNIILFHPE